MTLKPPAPLELTNNQFTVGTLTEVDIGIPPNDDQSIGDEVELYINNTDMSGSPNDTLIRTSSSGFSVMHTSASSYKIGINTLKYRIIDYLGNTDANSISDVATITVVNPPASPPSPPPPSPPSPPPPSPPAGQVHGPDSVFSSLCWENTPDGPAWVTNFTCHAELNGIPTEGLKIQFDFRPPQPGAYVFLYNIQPSQVQKTSTNSRIITSGRNGFISFTAGLFGGNNNAHLPVYVNGKLFDLY